MLPPETGHGRLEAGAINKQAIDHYSKKFQISKTVDRVKYFNENINVEMMEWKHFSDAPKCFEEAFLHQDKRLDQFQKIAGIKNDEGISHEFGESEV